jgi:hypothetical protein
MAGEDKVNSHANGQQPRGKESVQLPERTFLYELALRRSAQIKAGTESCDQRSSHALEDAGPAAG